MRIINNPVLDLTETEKLRAKNKVAWIEAQFKLGRQVYGYPVSNYPFFIAKDTATIDEETGNVFASDGEGHYAYLTFITLYGSDSRPNSRTAVWDDRKPFVKAEDYVELIWENILNQLR